MHRRGIVHFDGTKPVEQQDGVEGGSTGLHISHDNRRRDIKVLTSVCGSEHRSIETSVESGCRDVKFNEHAPANKRHIHHSHKSAASFLQIHLEGLDVILETQGAHGPEQVVTVDGFSLFALTFIARSV
eukprot:6494905-Pyramimonas_sp.AAC.2